MRSAFLLLVAIITTAHAQFLGNILTIDRDAEELILFGYLRPSDFLSFADFGQSVNTLTRQNTWFIKKRRFLQRNFVLIEARFDTLYRGFITFSAKVGFRKSHIVIEPRLKIGNSPEYPRHLWRNFAAGDFMNCYYLFEARTFKFFAGRLTPRIGPTPAEPLLFSGNAPPFDLVGFTFRKGRFDFSYFFTFLGRETCDSSQRFLNFHRIFYHPSSRVSLYFSETAVYGGKNAFPDLYYLNPFVLYYPRLWNRRLLLENIFWAFGLNIRENSKGAYCELVIDDFPYSPERNEHPKLAWLIGLLLREPFSLKSSVLAVNYRGATRWTFGHRTPYLSFIYDSTLIGPEEGNDFDRITIELRKQWNRDFGIFSLSYLRKGEGTPFEEEPTGNFPDPYFLTGVVEKRLTLNVEYAHLIGMRTLLGLKVHISNISNYQHKEGQKTVFCNACIFILLRL